MVGWYIYVFYLYQIFFVRNAAHNALVLLSFQIGCMDQIDANKTEIIVHWQKNVNAVFLYAV